MSCTIEGYTYDIFISYRQKDNKHDGWVTEFVNNLKGELESTFKEEISVYFDINPHDGLLETHDVDESLKEKLKCLIFIPIISRTYCDPKSFAWEHEFKAFLELVSQDQFGLKVRLPNGNVANRILPIRIHDLDASDIKECESVLGGVLRGVEFIYKEAGVDKPLAPDDDEKKNLNNTKYRIQIIKVAHSIKEIILGMKTGPILEAKEKDQPKESFKGVREEEQKIDQEKPAKAGRVRFLIPTAVVALIIIAGIIAYPKIFKRDTLEKLRSSGERISVAVMPFQNLTNDTDKNFWQEMIQDNLITALSNSEEFKVRQTESIKSLLQENDLTNYASITPSIASRISQKLEANVFVHGSISQTGTIVRLSAKLVHSETEEVFKSFQIDGPPENILQTSDSLSKLIRDFLLISQLKQKKLPDFQQYETTNSPDAYRNYLSGMNSFGKADFTTARDYFTLTMQYDSNFTLAALLLAQADINLQLFEEGKAYCVKAYQKKDHMSAFMKCKVNDMYAWYTEGPKGRIKYLRQLLEMDDQDPITYYHLGNSYRLLQQYDKSIPELEKSLDIYKSWGVKPTWRSCYNILGLAYHEMGQYKKEKKLYQKAEQDFPNNDIIIYRQAILSFTKEDTLTAEKYIDKFISILKDNSTSEALINNDVASIYFESGILNKAEACYRKALSLEPDNHLFMNNLAWLLIKEDLNITEGLELINKALVLNPDHYEYLDTKGLGLYKLERYQEALEILQKSWDLRMKNAVYYHEAFLHLEAAKKAVAGQKNN